MASSKKCQHHPELTGAASWFQSVWRIYLATTILVDKTVSLCAGVLNEVKWKCLKANARFGLCLFVRPFCRFNCICIPYTMYQWCWWWYDVGDDDWLRPNVKFVQKFSFTILLYQLFIYFTVSNLHCLYLYLKRKWHTLINRFKWIEFQNLKS